jgi:hypothetical protein
MSAVVSDDQLIDEFRGYATHVAGRGMHIPVSGDHIRAAIARIDTLTETVRATGHTEPAATEPAWQEPLASVVRILAQIIEDPAYNHLCGTNLVDALHAWTAHNHARLDDRTLTAVHRALSGG